jgi:hypothetical protein
MERILVGLTTVVLLLSSCTDVRAGYVFPRRFEAVGHSDGHWLNPLDAEPFGDGIVAETLSHLVDSSLGSISDLGGGRLCFEATSVIVVYPATGLVDELLRALARRFTSEITFFMNVASSRIHEAPFAYFGGPDHVLFGDVLLADLVSQRSDGSSEDPFLAKFGGLTKGEVQFAEPARFVLDSSTRHWSDKLIWSLALLGVGALGVIGYVWRVLKPKPYRYAAGRRPHAPYQSSNVPNPSRKIGSPPP